MTDIEEATKWVGEFGDEPSKKVFVLKTDDGKANARELEIKLQLWKRRYEEELSSFSECRIENVLKNSGVKEYFEKIKEKDRDRDEAIKILEKELHAKREEAKFWRNKSNNLEKQCKIYWHQLQETRSKLDEIEAEKRERSFYY